MKAPVEPFPPMGRAAGAAAGPSPNEVGALVDALMAQLPDARSKHLAEQLVSGLLQLYGDGLERLLDLAWRDDGSMEWLFARWAGDPLVSSLLLLHGLHPEDMETRVERALERVRPHLASHGGDVKLVEIARGAIRIRLEGTCNGCPSSALTMQTAVRRALEEAAPDASGIELVEDACAVSFADVDLVCPTELAELGAPSRELGVATT